MSLLVKFIVGSLFVSIVLVPFSHTQADSLLISKLSVEVFKPKDSKGATAVISWKTSNEARGKIDYGKTSSYGTTVSLNIAPRLDHSVVLTDLPSNTNFHFKVSATTEAGLFAETFDQTFLTPKWKEELVKDVMLYNVRIASLGASYAIVQWFTANPTDARVTCSLDPELKKGAFTASGPNNITAHEVVLKLKKERSYYCRAHSRERNSTDSQSAIFVVNTLNDDSGDKLPLTILEISPLGYPDPLIGEQSITVRWRTSHPALGSVQYDSKAGGKGTVKETGFNSLEHGVILTKLKANTSYRIKISSKDVLGRNITTNGSELRTLAPVRPSPPAPLPPALNDSGCRPYAYGQCRDLAQERVQARSLRDQLDNEFNYRTPRAALRNWYTLVKAYVYGGYPLGAIVQAVKYGGKTVHPTIPWSAWQYSADYQAYISRP